MYLTRHQTFRGPCWAVDGHWLPDGFHLDFMLQRSLEEIRDALANARTDEPAEGALHAPIEDTQEVWAAGVTYLRSREARMAESETADIYDRVYNAERVEVFFKANGWRVMGHGDRIRVRRDSTWNVPEPELALVLNRAGEIVGYTAGNDVSSRSIEGENPLYLPQAKVYDGSCALGPGIVIADPDTRCVICRCGSPSNGAAPRCSTARPAPRASSVRSRRSRSGSSPSSTSPRARSS